MKIIGRRILSIMISAVLLAGIITCSSVSANENLSNNKDLNYLVVEPQKYFASINESSYPTEQLQALLISAWDKKESTINIESLSIKSTDIGSIYYYILNENPKYFYVSSALKCSYDQRTGIVQQVVITYLCDTSNIPTLVAEFDTAANKALACVNESMSDEEKVLAIHDYLILNCKYDTDIYYNSTAVSEYSYTAYGCLVKNVAVCQGYADALKYLLNKLNITCSLVTSDAMGHAWNVVQLGGKYYHVDATWDDEMAISGDIDVDLIGKVVHKYFLLSDTEMAAAGHYSWDASGITAGASYSTSFWKDVESAIYNINGYQYYIDKNGDIIKRNTTSGATSVIYQIQDGMWAVKTVGNSQTYYLWDAKEAKLAYKDGLLYFNTNNKIYAINIDGTGLKQVYDSGLNLEYITGIGFVDETMYYDTMNENSIYTLRNVAVLTEPTTEITTEPITQTTTEMTTEQNINYGDVNNDGAVNSKDVLVLKQFLASWSVSINQLAADVTADGSINSKDSLRLKQYNASWDVTLGK